MYPSENEANVTNEFIIRYKEGCFIIACYMDCGLCVCVYEKERGREGGKKGRERGREREMYVCGEWTPVYVEARDGCLVVCSSTIHIFP